MSVWSRANSEVSFTRMKGRLSCDIFVNGQEHQSTAKVGRTIKLSGVLAGLVTNIFPFYRKEMIICLKAKSL